MTPEEELSRANEAAMILGNTLVREALGGIKEALIEQWRATPVQNTELREKIWAIYCASHKFEEVLRSHIETGKMAAVQVERDRTLKERAKEFFRAA